MNQPLLTAIENALYSAVSGNTKTLYYDALPNQDLLTQYSVVYSVRNQNNQPTFDRKDAVKNYSLTVQINNPNKAPIVSSSVFINSNVLSLYKANSFISIVTTENEELFYDPELKIFTGYLRFNMQTS
ncbi:MAG: hypothetical protein OJF59_002521 [Cytophagales bacterium]|mgnify:CR=1 FL=1|jgi:hypothetical protein|nr:hypothetical protein [Bacteroidota bacterium]MBS1980243.1 hypothetical protein [Bacteroidota bacterium]WHZ08767.1 MAG: hypothetical protein OJF59_002521 [Cytophagales bacterium]